MSFFESQAFIDPKWCSISAHRQLRESRFQNLWVSLLHEDRYLSTGWQLWETKLFKKEGPLTNRSEINTAWKHKWKKNLKIMKITFSYFFMLLQRMTGPKHLSGHSCSLNGAFFYPKAHSEYSPSLIPYAPWQGADLRIDVRNKQGAFSYMISLSTHLQQCMSISPGYSRILYMCPNLFSSVMQSAGRYIIHSRTIKNVYRGGKHHHLLSSLHIVQQWLDHDAITSSPRKNQPLLPPGETLLSSYPSISNHPLRRWRWPQLFLVPTLWSSIPALFGLF